MDLPDFLQNILIVSPIGNFVYDKLKAMVANEKRRRDKQTDRLDRAVAQAAMKALEAMYEDFLTGKIPQDGLVDNLTKATIRGRYEQIRAWRTAFEKEADDFLALLIGEQSPPPLLEFHLDDLSGAMTSALRAEFPTRFLTFLGAELGADPTAKAIIDMNAFTRLEAANVKSAQREEEILRLLVHSYSRARVKAFMPLDDFARRFSGGNRIFTHDYPLVGRSTMVQGFNEFLRGEELARVYTSPGGMGKTRLLLAMGQEAQLDGWSVLVAANDVPINRDFVSELPLDNYLLLVDDGHRRDDLNFLLEGLRQHPSAGSRIKVVIAGRPYMPLLQDPILEQVGNHETLKPLDPDDLIQIAQCALGPTYEGFATDLVRLAGDSVLVITIAGRIFASGARSFIEVKEHDAFRKHVLDAFVSEVSGTIRPSHDANFVRGLLRVIAALGYVRPDDATFRDRTARFLQASKSELFLLLDDLRDAGVLVDDGGGIRIYPDVLSEHILQSACITEAGKVTGFADELCEAFGDWVPDRLIPNLAVAEHLSGGRESLRITGRIWSALTARFQHATLPERKEVLHWLVRVAPFTPAPALAISEEAWKQRLDGLEDSVPPVLRQMQDCVELLPRIFNLLWAIGRDDNRPPHQTPDHPIRVLREIAGYGPGKPLTIQQQVVSATRRWCRESGGYQHCHSPLELLGTVLARQTLEEWTTQHGRESTLHMAALAVSAAVTMSVRKDALNLLTEEMDRAPLRHVASALDLLFGLAGPVPDGLVGHNVSIQEQEQWFEERLVVIGMLGRVLPRLSPCLQLHAKRELLWRIEESPDHIREAVIGILQQIPDSMALRVTRALAPFEYLPNEEWKEREGRILAHAEQTAEELVAMMPQCEQRISYLSARVAELTETGTGSTGVVDLLRFLDKKDQGFSLAAIDWLLVNQDAPLGRYIPVLLNFIRRRDVPAAESRLRRTIETGNPVLCGELAVQLAYRLPIAGTDSVEWDALVELVHFPDKRVRIMAYESVKRVPESLYYAACDVVLNAGTEDDQNVGEALCSIFSEIGGIPAEILRGERLEKLLSNLQGLPTLDSPSIQALLRRVLPIGSIQVARLLIHRAFACQDLYRVRDWQDDFSLEGISQAPDFEDLIRMLLDRSLEVPLGRAYTLSYLFDVVSERCSPRSVSVLNDWLQHGDERKIRAVGWLVARAPTFLLINQVDFVTRLLDSADVISASCYDEVAACLSNIAIGRGRSYERFKEQLRTVAGTLPRGSGAERFYGSLAE